MERFEFGKNWEKFVDQYNDTRLQEARQSIDKHFFISASKLMTSKKFLDIGCGSGLFSAAAYSLGCDVVSIDYDQNSVLATKKLREKADLKSQRVGQTWAIRHGDILDPMLLKTLGNFQYIYCWGVLHHTGDVLRAINNLITLADIDTRICISIYNDQGWISKYWLWVKRLYNKSKLTKCLMILVHFPYPFCVSVLGHILKNRGKRGMAPWTDYLDWIGGLPFEPLTPQVVIKLFEKAGFKTIDCSLVGNKHGCNEFIFQRLD